MTYRSSPEMVPCTTRIFLFGLTLHAVSKMNLIELCLFVAECLYEVWPYRNSFSGINKYSYLVFVETNSRKNNFPIINDVVCILIGFEDSQQTFQHCVVPMLAIKQL